MEHFESSGAVANSFKQSLSSLDGVEESLPQSLTNGRTHYASAFVSDSAPVISKISTPVYRNGGRQFQVFEAVRKTNLETRITAGYIQREWAQVATVFSDIILNECSGDMSRNTAKAAVTSTRTTRPLTID